MECERRLGAFIRVHVVAQTVAATAGRKVIERPPKPVASEEPLERSLGARTVFGIARDGERSDLCLHERRCVERLLVARPRCGLAAMTPFVARETQEPFAQSALVTEPSERL